MATQREAVAAARAFREAGAAALVREFATLLAIENRTGDLAALRRNAAYLHDAFAARGAQMDVVEVAGAAPAVVGRLDGAGPGPVLGMYVHYDGQPADPAAWTGAPWEPALYSAPIDAGGQRLPLPGDGDRVDPEWRLYARSAADDKAPFAAILGAVDALAAAGLQRSTSLVFLFEGEEEHASPHLGDYMAALRDRLRADLWLICDGPVHQSRRPQVVFGVRGYCGLEVTVYGPLRELHSGHYGNWAPNPAQLLAGLLASMKDSSGRVLVDGFYDSALPPSDAERAAIAALPDIDDELRREFGLGATEADGAPYAERLMLPSLNVRGMRAGDVGAAARNVIPERAAASLDIRLVPGDEPGAMLDLVEKHMRAQGFHVTTAEPDAATRRAHGRIVRVERDHGYQAARAPLDEPTARAIVAAAGEAAGGPVVTLPTFGGSVPLYRFREMLETPAVILPIANHDNNQHGPDENLRLGNLWLGMDLWAALLTMPVG